MTKDILYDFKSLICTDPDCLQFAKKENGHSWWYIQIIDHNILDEYEGHEEDFITAYENGAIVNGIDSPEKFAKEYQAAYYNNGEKPSYVAKGEYDDIISKLLADKV